jgi:chemotaxis protein MotB
MMLPGSSGNRHSRGQADHVDAWLMSYADLITLLFLFFVIFVSMLYSRQNPPADEVRSEPGYAYVKPNGGMLSLETPFEGLYRTITGIVAEDNADTHIAIEKTTTGLKVDLSAITFFDYQSAEIKDEHRSVIARIAKAVIQSAPQAFLAVEGYTDDAKPIAEKFANNWELSAMRAARVATVLEEEGIPSSRLRVAGMANNQPIVPNIDARGNAISENRLRNQRVVIRIEEPAKK